MRKGSAVISDLCLEGERAAFLKTPRNSSEPNWIVPNSGHGDFCLFVFLNPQSSLQKVTINLEIQQGAHRAVPGLEHMPGRGGWGAWASSRFLVKALGRIHWISSGAKRDCWEQRARLVSQSVVEGGDTAGIGWNEKVRGDTRKNISPWGSSEWSRLHPRWISRPDHAWLEGSFRDLLLCSAFLSRISPQLLQHLFPCPRNVNSCWSYPSSSWVCTELGSLLLLHWHYCFAAALEWGAAGGTAQPHCSEPPVLKINPFLNFRHRFLLNRLVFSTATCLLSHQSWAWVYWTPAKEAGLGFCSWI